MTHLLLCLDKAIGHDKRNMKSSFWYNVNEFLRSNTLTSLIQLLPEGLRDRVFFLTVIFALVIHFEQILHKCIAKASKTEATPTHFTSKCYLEIQRYVGWAIFSRTKVVEGKVRALKDKWEKQSGGNNSIDYQLGSLYSEMGILNSMSTCEENIKKDDEYMKTYYPTVL